MYMCSDFMCVTYQSAQTGCTHLPSASDVKGALLVGWNWTSIESSIDKTTPRVIIKVQQAEAASHPSDGARKGAPTRRWGPAPLRWQSRQAGPLGRREEMKGSALAPPSLAARASRKRSSCC